MKSEQKDILLICKGHYDEAKYGSIEEALLAYYQKYYDEDTTEISYRLIFDCWLKPCIFYFLDPLNAKPEDLRKFIGAIIFNESGYEKTKWLHEEKDTYDEFYKTLCHRLFEWLYTVRVKDNNNNWLVDLSDYDLKENIV